MMMSRRANTTRAIISFICGRDDTSELQVSTNPDAPVRPAPYLHVPPPHPPVQLFGSATEGGRVVRQALWSGAQAQQMEARVGGTTTSPKKREGKR